MDFLRADDSANDPTIGFVFPFNDRLVSWIVFMPGRYHQSLTVVRLFNIGLSSALRLLYMATLRRSGEQRERPSSPTSRNVNDLQPASVAKSIACLTLYL